MSFSMTDNAKLIVTDLAFYAENTDSEDKYFKLTKMKDQNNNSFLYRGYRAGMAGGGPA